MAIYYRLIVYHTLTNPLGCMFVCVRERKMGGEGERERERDSLLVLRKGPYRSLVMSGSGRLRKNSFKTDATS